MNDNHSAPPRQTFDEPRIPFGSDFQAILSLIGDAVVSTNHQGHIIFFNRAAEGMFGYSSSELLGRPIDALIPIRFRNQHQNDYGDFFATEVGDRRAMGAGREVSGRRKDGTELAIEVSLSRQFLDGDHIGTAVIRDVSVRMGQEKQRQLVASEVAHRLRNMMAVMNSIVSLTARASLSTTEFENALLGRFSAISRTNESLIRGSWIEANLSELLESELAPYRVDDRRILLTGPAVAIDREVAVALALVFHELATNAAKYGALSTPTGRLEVVWRTTQSEKRMLEVMWREINGPAVSPPTRRGFGSTLIAKSLRGLGGRAELTYLVTGVTCSLSLPVA